MGEGAAWIDPGIIHNVSAAVLHYFKQELSRDFVSVGEFAIALEKALRGFGLSVYADSEPRQRARRGKVRAGIEPARTGQRRRQGI